MPSNYIQSIEKRARQQLEQLNQAQQRAIIEAYNSAGKELVRQYRGAKDGTATKALYASYTKKLYDETNEIIQRYAIKGAQVAPSVEKLVMQKAFQMAGLDTSLADDKFDNLIGKLGMESVKNVIGGKIYKDGAGLSPRIWQASAMSSNKIQEVITAGLAQDMGAAKLSELLRAYVDPTVRKTWDNDKIRSVLGDGYAAWNKNLEYNALRLARTTLSHTATMSMRQARQVNPYATKIKWHSVHAAGRTCETCEEMDGQVFKTEECPFDHPNGMCYQTHELEKSLDEIADELAAWCNGEENEMLDKWWKGIGGTDEKPGFVSNVSIHKIVQGTDMSATFQRREAEYKFAIEDIINAQGFDGLPQVVSSDDFEQAVSQSNFFVQRTYTAPNQEALDAYRDQLYHGKWYIDCSSGGAAHGQGMYVAGYRGTSANNWLNAQMQGYGSFQQFSYTETMTFTKDVKIVSSTAIPELRTSTVAKRAEQYLQSLDIIPEQREYLKMFSGGALEIDAYKASSSSQYLITSGLMDETGRMAVEFSNFVSSYRNSIMDDGVLAAINGYDAIEANRGEGSYFVVLNRTKVIIDGGK